MKSKLLLILFILFFASCKRVLPGGFWTGLRSKEITFKKLDHGPWGGTTEIHWKKDLKAKRFTSKEIIEYAEKNGWRYEPKIDSEEKEFSNTILNEGFSNVPIAYNSSLLRFHSNLATINEDSNLNTTVNCFAVLNPEGSTLVIYYRWGDF